MRKTRIQAKRFVGPGSFTRRNFLLVAALIAFGVPACAPAQTDERPNFILLMGDDHGWEETGYNGHPDLHTPVLDEMAASGLRLDRFYAAAAVCSPTRGSVLTGRHPNRYGTFGANFSLRPEEISIAHILGEAGYARAHFGKWHLGPVKKGSPTNPGAMGFEEWLSHDNFFEMNPPLSHNGGPPRVFEGEGSEILVAEALRFIQQAGQNGRPFLVVIWFASPHEPYDALEQDLTLYDEVPGKYGERPVTLTSMETGRPVQRLRGEVLRERYAEITAMDRAIGQLRKSLAEMGLRENTLLWYCGDNGTPTEGVAVSPLRSHKGSIYDGGVRVPAIIEWPAGVPEPRLSDVVSVTSDILPTLCDLAEQPLPDRPLDGISLKPLIDGAMTERSRPIAFWNFDTSRIDPQQWKPYIDPELQAGTTPLVKLMNGIATRNFRNYRHPGVSNLDFGGSRALVNNRYKVVVDGDVNGQELFDLQSDPGEKHNLIDIHTDTADAMMQELRSWQESVLNSLTGADYR